MRGRLSPWLLVVTLSLVAVPSAAAQVSADEDPARGIVYRGLSRAQPGGPCSSLFELRQDGRLLGCTHGPDPAPPGVDVRQRREAPVSGLAMEGTSPVLCQGDGQSGYRVQLVYARASDVPDRYTQFLASFRQWAAQMDDIFRLSAAETGGTRHVQFVHDASCVPTVEHVVLPPDADDNFTLTRNNMLARGYSRVDRKYLIWMDATLYCGMADLLVEDAPDQNNVHNGSGRYPAMMARVDSACWGQTLPSGLVEAHELVHTLGGVQSSAPNATPNGHCTDEYDLMCYRDGQGVVIRIVCDNVYDHENRLDCNHDDYFHTSPPAGSYLATHWNVANNRFLTSRGVTTVSPSFGDPGDSIMVSGTGAVPFHGYRAKLGTSVGGCPTSSIALGGSAFADASGNIAAVARTIPTNSASGSRFICLASDADPQNDYLTPSPFTVF